MKYSKCAMGGLGAAGKIEIGARGRAAHKLVSAVADLEIMRQGLMRKGSAKKISEVDKIIDSIERIVNQIDNL